MEDDIKMEDDIEMADDFVDEHQNDMDSPGENEPPVKENLEIDEVEDKPEFEEAEIEINEDW
jgi:hypothetical protein